MVDYEAALSNSRAALDGTEGAIALQIHTNARDALNSPTNTFLEYDRVREIRKLPAENTYDLVTSNHHYIAQGVIVHNCDIRINNDLDRGGYSFHGTKPWLDHAFDSAARAAEEDIYDALMSQGWAFIVALKKMMGDAWKGTSDGNQEENPEDHLGDMVPNEDKEDIAKAISNVVQAAHQARLAGHAGDIPGEVETLLKEFLSPVVPWEKLLHKFFHDLCEEDYSWRRPNRRFHDIYLPSRVEDDGKLDHLIYYLDVSGSVTDSQVIRFNSEVKFIKDTFKPRKLTLVQFDTRITQEKTFLEEDDFVELVVVGRGGTDLTPVREHMIENNPTAAVIFSDLYCRAMEKLPQPLTDLPTIWVAIDNKNATVNFGELIHIRG